MKNKITNLKISNFKSIKEAELECGRINLFVGKPNVGKSNLLEAIAALGLYYNRNEKFLSDFIRYDKLSNLFYFQNTEDQIVIDTDYFALTIYHDFEKNIFNFTYHRLPDDEDKIDRYIEESNQSNIEDFDFHDEDYPYEERKEILLNEKEKWVKNYIQVNSNGIVINGNPRKIWTYPIKKYFFTGSKNISTRGKNFLAPPQGDNLFWILQSNKKLKEEIPQMFEEYGLEFLIDLEENKFAVQRKENGIVYKIPYHLIADTLQRIIFHYAAIFSNKDSVILFEEPESHSFPPYIRDLAFKIIESTENQFFITTHSPYLFDTILENTPPEDLALFITYFENYETKFKKLDDEEIAKIMDYGLEVFFNLNHFVNE